MINTVLLSITLYLRQIFIKTDDIEYQEEYEMITYNNIDILMNNDVDDTDCTDDNLKFDLDEIKKRTNINNILLT